VGLLSHVNLALICNAGEHRSHQNLDFCQNNGILIDFSPQCMETLRIPIKLKFGTLFLHAPFLSSFTPCPVPLFSPQPYIPFPSSLFTSLLFYSASFPFSPFPSPLSSRILSLSSLCPAISFLLRDGVSVAGCRYYSILATLRYCFSTMLFLVGFCLLIAGLSRRPNCRHTRRWRTCIVVPPGDCERNPALSCSSVGPIHRKKWRHRIYGHETIVILWV